MAGGAPVSTTARFNAGAQAYARLWAPVLAPFGAQLVEALPLASTRRILDIGAGTGSLCEPLRAAAPHARVTATDVSPAMLALAPAELDRVVCDAACLPFREAAFDAALMAFAIFFVADPGAALAEACRVLRPGGAFALTSWNGEPEFPAHTAWLDETRALGVSAAPWPAEAIEPDRLAGALARVGFTEVQLWLARFDHRHEPENFLELRMSLARPWLERIPSEARAAFLARVRARLAAIPPDGFVDPSEIIYATARRKE